MMVIYKTIWQAQLEAAAFKSQQIPPESDNCPEIAIAGRSNVGKSSLINALLGAKLAHVGATPGKTRSINFYRVNVKFKTPASDNLDKTQAQAGTQVQEPLQKIFRLVDLPGYGYASRSKSERNDWMKLTSSYLERRKSLNLVCHLVDFRHGLLQNDHELQEWLRHYGKNIFVVFTKADKISRGRWRSTLMQYVQDGLFSADVPIITSSEVSDSNGKRPGIDELRAYIERVV